ncbi:MAG: penicillin-binding protein, partial [Chthonomonadales bacterium]|nr:penicillin-binding protein [Chthonomonadales bacterium]
LLTFTAAGGKLAGQLPDGTPDLYLPLSPTSFWQPDNEDTITFVKSAGGDITGLKVKDSEGKERSIPRIGPLIHTLTSQSDPDPARTRKIDAALRTLMLGDKTQQAAAEFTPGLRRDFTDPITELAGMKSIAFLAEQDVADRGIVRHDGKVSRIRYYKLHTGTHARNILIYFTADNLFTDLDVVDD